MEGAGKLYRGGREERNIYFELKGAKTTPRVGFGYSLGNASVMNSFRR